MCVILIFQSNDMIHVWYCVSDTWQNDDTLVSGEKVVCVIKKMTHLSTTHRPPYPIVDVNTRIPHWQNTPLAQWGGAP